ncbi:hypothetical protein T11_9911 [Trichinella zimbabwensis]|uniref:PiggyBac transposable element-derived protein domain-containing protein n=1 Tax=Trichinella zimbabwensis TaxID=268475 RepID=A0A0V1GV32_9BILA|nr:hypothetical protein T11_9911 [Trichinella zimbabwensis]
MTSFEAKRLYKDAWKQINETESHDYIILLILAGNLFAYYQQQAIFNIKHNISNSHREATNSLWNTENGRPIFPSVMSLDNFQRISRIIRFDDRETRSHRHDWIARLPMMCNPGAFVTVDERLIPFRER